jgi:protein-disulfide isomerase
MKSETKNYIIVALVTALVVLGIVWLRDGGTTGVTAPTPTVAAGGGAPTVANVNIENNYFKGDEDAPVTIVEFSDFQCPFCSRFFVQTLPSIQQQYIATGKVKLVYKDFPLDSIHPEATPAANAARCAGDQGKFWEFHDLLFANTQTLGDASYKAWATQLGLDTATFNSCVDSQEHLSAIRQDLVEGQQAGIRGTPGFLLNGRIISGACPFTTFQQAIAAEDAGSSWSSVNCQIQVS